MALPLSPNSISTDQIRTELGLAAGTDIIIPSAAIRTLTGISSGNIRLPDDFWGKSNTANVRFDPVGTFGSSWQFAACGVVIWTNGQFTFYNLQDSPTPTVWTWKDNDDVNPNSTFEYMYTLVSGNPGLTDRTYGSWYGISNAYPNGASGTFNGDGYFDLTIREKADHSNTATQHMKVTDEG
jgi:hypothetical protein